MKTKELLNEWRNFLNEELITEVSLKKFEEKYPQFDTSSFTSQLKGNTDYLDIISNSIDAGQNHGPDDFIQQFEFYKNSIEPNRHRQDFLTISVPGEDESISLSGKLNPGSCTATYDDIQQFQQARTYVLGKGNKSNINALYTSIISNADVNDFELVAENDSWIIFYPKTMRASIALARSYWDGVKVSYDETFNPSRGFGENVGNMRWCTSISGGGNMFLNYHRRLNLHMYYCINKEIGQIENPLRKLCVSLSKKHNRVKFFGNTASVNANNTALTAEKAKSYLGSLFNNLLQDAEQEKRLEIDVESYYSSISLEQYITMRNANEENISDFLCEVDHILDYAKESKEILNHIINDSNPDMRALAANHPKTPPEALVALARDKSAKVRCSVARNRDTPTEVLEALARDKSAKVRLSLASNRDTPPEVLIALAQDEDVKVKISVANNDDAPPEALAALARDESLRLRQFVASSFNTPPEVLIALAQTEDAQTKCRVGLNDNTPPEALEILANDKSAKVRECVANNDNTPQEILALMVKDKSANVRNNLVYNPNTPPEALEILANDKSEAIRDEAIERLKNTQNETLLRNYIKLMMS